jgi:hypothetical protein
MAIDSVGARSKRRRLPSVDVPKVQDDELRRSLESLKEHVRMYEGDSGAPKERFVTIEELEKAGLIGTKLQNNFALIDSIAGNPVTQGQQSSSTSLISNQGSSGSDTLEGLSDTSVAGAPANSFLQLKNGQWVGTSLFAGQHTWTTKQTFVDCIRIAGIDSGFVDFQHDNTDLNITGSSTTSLNISGMEVTLDNAKGINWGTTELLIKTSAVGISSEWGSSMNSDWTAFGVVADTAALESTGILQDSIFGMDGFDVSDDGLHAIMCEQSGDRIVAYDLDGPYDFENATRTGAIHSGTGAFNPGDGIQWINSGASYLLHRLSASSVDIFNCPSPYTVNGSPGGPAQSVTNATLGWLGTAAYKMSRDGTKLIGSGNNGDSTYSVKIFELATPFVITTGRTLLSTYTYTGDTNAPNGKMNGMSLSEDGLSLIFNYSTAQINIGNMTVPFDVTTMTFPGARNVQSSFGNNPWNGNHITPDGNSLYVFRTNSAFGAIARYDKTVPNPAVQDATFIVGDPTTPTQIDGTATNITSAATDIDGTLNVDGLATFQADVTISDDLTITSGAPKIFMQDSDATADEGNWIIANTTDQFRIETASDAAPETPVEAAITIGRTGTAVDSVDIGATDVTITSTTIDINGVDPTIHLGEVTGAQSLSLDVTAISNQIVVEADALDSTPIEDNTDGGLKKTTLSSITDGGFF